MKGRLLGGQIFRVAIFIATSVSPVIFSSHESTAGQVRVNSAGGFSCRIFAEGASHSRQNEAIQWVIGYLSGRITADPGAWHRDFRGAEGIAQAITTYCRRRPYAPIVEAADWFFEYPRN